MKIRIAILGHLDSTRPARAMIGRALEHSAKSIQATVEYSWTSNSETKAIDICQVDGIFVGPVSPSEEHDGILDLIKSARMGKVPCLGTCGGFQRIVTEYAINELRLENVEHQEINPNAVNPLFSMLDCSLVGLETEEVLRAKTKIREIYRQETVVETFFCSYGVNPKFINTLESKGLKVAGHDQRQDVRVLELADHPFFVGTLFVPQVRSTEKCPHPLITAFLKASPRRAEQANDRKSGYP